MKLITLVLVVCLVLCGCAPQPESDPPPPASVTAPATEPVELYDAASVIEELTNGILKVYPLNINDAAAIAPMDGSILLFSGLETTTLTRFSEDTLRFSATLSLDCKISPDDPAVQVNEKGITFYDSTRNALVFLNTQLEEVRCIPLPDTISGVPALSADLQSLYYCTGDGLRHIDLETKLDRLLKEMHFRNQTATALHCNDSVILCDAEDTDGSCRQLFISTSTGILLYETSEELQLQTCGASYFARCMDGIYPELLVGDSEQGPTLLNPHTYGAVPFPLLETGGVVLATESKESPYTQLDYYDLRTGRRTAAITLPDRSQIYDMAVDDQSCIWFLRYDPEYSCDVLYSWDFSKSEVDDRRNCFSSRYSFDNPDWDGLVDCREIADRLSGRYGVQILLWTDATAFQPWDYTLVPEYQVSVIRENLKELEYFLSMYPEGFFQKAAEKTGSARIQICLVRSILGRESVDGTLAEAVGLQYWDDNANTYLCLSVQPEQLARNACHEMSHIIDSRVLTFCKAYDDWEKLNPKGFQYNYGSVSDLSVADRRWTVGSDRAFLDLYSMTYPKEDRARIMEYAMADGYEASFRSETMQKKLRMLCLGIRQAFGLETFAKPLRWEQYLETPLYP